MNRYYSNAAAEYDLFAHTCAYHDDFQNSIAEYLQKRGASETGTFLEIGSGTGLTTEVVCARFPNARIIATDNDQAMIECAKEKLASQKNIIWHCVDACELLSLLEPGTMDAVFSGYCFHNLTPLNRVRAYDLIGKVLKPGAPLVIGDKITRDDPLEHWIDFTELMASLDYYDSADRPDLKRIWVQHYLDDNANRLTESEQRMLFRVAWCSNVQLHNRWLTDAVMSAVRIPDVH